MPLLRGQFSLWLIKKLKSIQTKKLKKFCSCQVKQRVSGVKESNHLMYKMSVHLVALKVLFFANSFVCLFWPSLREPKLVVNLFLGVFFSSKNVFRCASISWFQAVSGWVSDLPFSAGASTGLSDYFFYFRSQIYHGLAKFSCCCFSHKFILKALVFCVALNEKKCLNKWQIFLFGL